MLSIYYRLNAYFPFLAWNRIHCSSKSLILTVSKITIDLLSITILFDITFIFDNSYLWTRTARAECHRVQPVFYRYI